MALFNSLTNSLAPKTKPKSSGATGSFKTWENAKPLTLPKSGVLGIKGTTPVSKPTNKAITDFAVAVTKTQPKVTVKDLEDLNKSGATKKVTSKDTKKPKPTEKETKDRNKDQFDKKSNRGGGGTPTVLSSGGIIEEKIPRIQQRFDSLVGNTTGIGGNLGTGSATFGSLGGSTGGFGDSGGFADYDPEDLFGISEEPKKKKRKGEVDLSSFDPLTGWGTSRTGVRQRSSNWRNTPLGSLEAMQETADKEFKQRLNTIREDYDQYEQEQQAANESGLNQITNALNLGGSSRYAPVSSQGIVQAQQAAGIKALSNLSRQENQLIAEATAAKEAQDYQLLNQKLNAIESIRAEKLGVAGSVQEGIQGNMQRAQRDNEIASLVQQGITSPMQLLRSLNYDADGNQIGDYTIAEIGAAMKGLGDLSGPAGVFEFDKSKIGGLLASGIDAQTIKAIQADLNSGADIDEVLGAGSGFSNEQASAVRKALGADAMNMMTNMQPGKGAKNAAEEFAIRTRLFGPVAAILNRGVISDADRIYLNDVIGFARAQGFDEQQLLDEISGWGVDVNTPFNNGFRDVLLVNRDEGENITNDLAQLGGMLKRGNYKMAMDKVENIALAKMQDEPGYMGKTEAEMYTKWIDSLKQTAVNSGVGLVSGNYQNVLGKLKSSDATKLKAELQQLYDKLDPKTAGDMIADITDKKSNFFAKLDVYQDRILADHNATRSTVGLPEVNVIHLLDPNERLNLYVDRNASTDSINSLGI